MKHCSRFSFACVALLTFAFGVVAASDPAFRQLNHIVTALSDITGLKQIRPVQYGRMNKRQLHRFLVRRVRKTLRPEEIRADELALKMFGLVPQDFDLKTSTIDLLTEQAAAFYDYDAKKLFLLQDSSLSTEGMTLAHELSHALADQHYDLTKFMDEQDMQDDENLAHSAVVEGQASWLMIAYELKQAGEPPVPSDSELENMFDSSDGSLSAYPVLKSSPLYIQQSLLFPYLEGTLFFNAVYKREDKAAFADVFTDPPIDSAQILHPERYFEHIKPSTPALPEIAELKRSTKLNEGSLGEFDHRLLLWQFINERAGKALAAALVGSDFRILGMGKQHRPVLLYSSDWSTEQHATEFLADYETVLHKKWQKCDVTLRRSDLLEGEGDDGFFLVRLAGRNVTSIEGLPSAAVLKSIAGQVLSPARDPATPVH